MDPLKSQAMPAQDALSGAAPKKEETQAFLQGAAEIDDCMKDFLASLDFIDPNDEAFSLKNTEAEKNEVILNNSSKETLSADNINTINEVAEKEAEVALHEAFIGTVDDNGKDALIAVSSASHEQLAQAQAGNRLVVVRGNVWGMSPEYAASRNYKDGDKIKWNGQEITIRYLSPSEMKSLSTVVTTFIFQIVQKEQNVEKEQVSEEHKNSKSQKPPLLRHTTVIRQHHNNDVRETSTQDGNEAVKSSKKKDELRMLEAVQDQAATDQKHKAREIERLKEKKFLIQSNETRKYDASNTNHLLEVLKLDHNVRQVPRQTLNNIKRDAS